MDEIRTDRPSLYDEDVVAWAEQQAAALRALGARPDLSNTLDWENIIEEVEDVGRSQIRTLEGTLQAMLVHVLKYLSAPRAQSVRSWRAEIIAFHATARRRYTRSMRQRIDWDGLWRDSKAVAAAELAVWGDELATGLPDRSPFTPEELVAEDFTLDGALLRLASILQNPNDHH
ncbi:protein of unknown function DUF29 [Methylobacterium sp. ap11]|jgi:hypothetical protein|uniref:DUF29 domain-containing protein n=1 Tax=Methylobacterium sp. ap11 TaxID=1761799 RepID=UPI0008C315F8|nr:DUF29 domain-containing protein [Methylobacterium sp. ap11]SEO91917.1 protein of unknown function DUF29 [Methylobacterium sp. ap11]